MTKLPDKCPHCGESEGYKNNNGFNFDCGTRVEPNCISGPGYGCLKRQLAAVSADNIKLQAALDKFVNAQKSLMISKLEYMCDVCGSDLDEGKRCAECLTTENAALRADKDKATKLAAFLEANITELLTILHNDINEHQRKAKSGDLAFPPCMPIHDWLCETLEELNEIRAAIDAAREGGKV